jgi:hypothetical protein
MSLVDMIRRQATDSPIPVFKVPSVRDLNLDSKEPESAPNLANQPSVDVSRPDPRPPSPQAPSQGPLIAAQPAYSMVQREDVGMAEEDIVVRRFHKPEVGVPGGIKRQELYELATDDGSSTGDRMRAVEEAISDYMAKGGSQDDKEYRKYFKLRDKIEDEMYFGVESRKRGGRRRR